MTRNISFLLRRAYERLVASVAALAVTGLMLVSVNAHAASGVEYHNEYCGVFVVRDDRIATVREYIDSKYAA